MNKASNKPYGLPMNIQFFADGADANIDQTGENGAQGAQEAAGQAKTYTEEELQSEINQKNSSLKSIAPYSSAWRVRSAMRKSVLKRRAQKAAARLKSWRRCRRNSARSMSGRWLNRPLKTAKMPLPS